MAAVVYPQRVRQPLLVVLVALAAYRAWRLLARDELLNGPRAWLFSRFPPDDKWATYRVIMRARREGRAPTSAEIAASHGTASRVGVFIDCPWCMGFWLTALVTYLVWHFYGLLNPWLVWPAASTLVGLVGKLDG